MPRPYRLGQRQAIADQTRTRIVEAAREVLVAAENYTSFSIEAVARQADVARMTVYHQFGSKLGLLEAVCDSLAASGGMDQLAAVFRSPHLDEALALFVAAFSRFWSADRAVIRRLNAFAVFDPDFTAVMQARNDRRRQALTVLLERHFADSPAARRGEIVAVLFTLTSFECFDLLAGASSRALDEVTPRILRLVKLALADMGHDELL